MSSNQHKHNHIGDEAAEDMRNFYKDWLSRKALPTPAKYEANFYLGLIAWREKDLEAMQYYFPRAAKLAVSMFSEKSANSDAEKPWLFDFIHPLFLILTFGDEDDKKQLSSLPNHVWVVENDDASEFESLVLLLDEIKNHLADLNFNVQASENIATINNSFAMHPFYQSWIAAMLNGIEGAIENSVEKVTSACQTLLELHREEALEGDYKLRFEGVLAFWVLALCVIAKKFDVSVELESIYLPKL